MREREVHERQDGSGDKDWPRLAVIDDHELMREGLRALILRQAPAGTSIVYCGGSPDQASRCLPQVALLDVDLGPTGPPLLQGMQILQGAGAHVLLMSAYEDARAVRAALRAGALGFVPKRVSFEELARAVQVVARGELYLSIDLASILATAAETPDLSPRELDALRLYASGLKLSAVAHRMGVSPHTAREYLDRARMKYAQVGRAARTRTELYAEASRDGLLDGPA
ncbi:MAG: response regulator transcription factor [Actinomycetales bacterium]|nr:response regulator transcription factor [Actinomycetales bacterium]